MEQQQVTNAAPAATSYGVHTPERHPDETQYDYRMRREWSRRAVREMIQGRPIDPRTLGKPPSSTDLQRAAAKAKRPAPTQPKFPKARTRKHARHPLQDDHGTYTVTGPVVYFEGMQRDSRYHVMGGDSEGNWHGRRKWLGGISAQRGY